MALRPVFGSDAGLTLSARTSITIRRQDGWEPNDVVVISAMLRDITVVPTMPGWTPIGRQVNSTASRGHQLVAFWRRDDGTGTSWSMSWDGSSVACDMAARAWRGAPPAGSPIDGYAAASTSTTGGAIPYAPTTIHGAATVIWLACSYQTTYPFAAEQWWYGPDSGDGYVQAFEYPFGSAGPTPTPAPLSGHSTDAWTSMTFAIKDSGFRDAAYDTPFGVAGVSSPANGGWPGGYADLAELGANYVRVDFGPGLPTANADAEFADATDAGFSVLPVITEYAQLSTIDKDAFANYVASFVQRYGPGGDFWADRDDGHLAPVEVEVFNEPWGFWFYGVVEPADYADVFIRSVTAGRAANPACRYLIAGVDRYRTRAVGGTWADWFAPMFAAQPTLGDCIDGVTFHEYGVTPLNISDYSNYQQWPQLESVIPDLMSRGVNVRAWITEFGFTTTSNQAAPDYGVSEQQQATQIGEALRLFHGRWSDLIGATFLFRYRDGPDDERESRWGIVNFDGTRKPAFDALRALLPMYVAGLAPALASKFGTALFDALGPWQTDHLAWYCDAIGTMFDPVYSLVNAQGNDGDPDFVPGWGTLFDVSRCPLNALPYLGQFVGVQIPKGSSEQVSRSLVRAESGLNRGTLSSIQGAIERSISTPWEPTTAYASGVLLTHDPGDGSGSRFYVTTTSFASGTFFDTTNLAETDPALWYRIFERQRPDTTPDAYALTVYVRPEQLTPTNDTTAIVAAITATKPAGILLYVIATDSPRWLDATLTWATATRTATWANVQAGNV